tara:strand:- start:1261 stop:1875 length:615 start_codon:yes stop_codon:yes gene_type:complete
MIDASIVWQMILSKMKVKNGYETKVINDDSNYFVCRLDLNSETLVAIQVVIESSTLPKKVRIEFTGSAPIEFRPDVVTVHKSCSHCAGLLDRFIVEATNNIPHHSIGKRANYHSFNLTRESVDAVNSSLSEISHIGYPSVESLLSAIFKVLKGYELDLVDPVSSHWLKQKSGTFSSDFVNLTDNKLAVSFYCESYGFVADCYIV